MKMNMTDIDRIQILTSDIQKLNDFIESVKLNIAPIQALYIITRNQFKIDLKGNFSDETTRCIFDLILKEKTKLLETFEAKLNEVIELSKQS